MLKLLLICLPSLLCAIRVELAHDFTAQPQELFAKNHPSALWAELQASLSNQDIHLEAPDTFSPSADTMLCWNFPKYIKKHIKKRGWKKDKAVLFLWEPPTTSPKLYTKKVLKRFSKIYTWDDALVDNQTFFKLHYPVLQPMAASLPSFEEKKLCTLIVSNKTSRHPLELYSEREAAIRFFEELPDSGFEFYGIGWEDKNYKNYRGAVADKLETLKRYRFAICYENMRGVTGYVTEKLFDCFAAGCVPIYWGAENIEEYVPRECFIDKRAFSSYLELHAFLQNMKAQEYEKYLSSIQIYLKSEKAQIFSSKHFIKTVAEAVSK
jgi:alpha(1,3/1,4) fucosyltransferase